MSRNRLTSSIVLAATTALATSSGLAAPLSLVTVGALAPAATSQPVTTPTSSSVVTAATYPVVADVSSPALFSLYAQAPFADGLSTPVAPLTAMSSTVSFNQLAMVPALGLSASALGGAGGVQPSMLGHLLGSMQLGAGTLGRWEDYVMAELMPQSVDFTLDRAAYDFAPSTIDESVLLPSFARLWRVDRQRYVTFGVQETQASESFVLSNESPFLRRYDSALNLERRYLSAGLAQSFGEHSTLGVAAVTAYQHFATYSAGSNSVVGIADSSLYRGRETTVGTGIRVGLASELAEGVSVGATYQSRIDMDPFQSYRGVYSDPADFDVPASAGVGVALQASSSSAITFDVQRVLYSDVNAFTSSLMPDRFLSLLGDGTSPNFAWQDLTVYSVGYQWETSEDLRWHVNYSTRQQPLPTDDQLAQALTPGFADNNVRVGFSKQLGRSSRLNFAASYVPDGIYRASSGDSDLDQVEIEAFWVWDF